jgi:hypothetical protein
MCSSSSGGGGSSGSDSSGQSSAGKVKGSTKTLGSRPTSTRIVGISLSALCKATGYCGIPTTGWGGAGDDSGTVSAVYKADGGGGE